MSVAGTSEVTAFDRNGQSRRGRRRGSERIGANNKQNKEQFQAAKDAKDAAGPSMEHIETWFEGLEEPRTVG